ncbi:hypothetical protein O6H91_07G125200 [Diphasiastrum complanatum]|uniref:Uncharacterized protein n=1 Tax=Diphasiastrum complanatum TaxID=34168 RepID=A0ACC2D9M5_DIPCM|nr:hypothetical protein O6H91_07G125200 [Diphasiastrum complanatum]
MGPMSNMCFICGETRHFMVDCKVNNQYHVECPDCVQKRSFKDCPKQPNRILPAQHISSEPVRVLTRAQCQNQQQQQNLKKPADHMGSSLTASTLPRDYLDPRVEQRQYNEFRDEFLQEEQNTDGLLSAPILEKEQPLQGLEVFSELLQAQITMPFHTAMKSFTGLQSYIHQSFQLPTILDE